MASPVDIAGTGQVADEQRRATAMRAIGASVATAVVVCALRWIAWRITGSVALYSDAIESLVNVAGAVVALLAIRVAHEPPDLNHPWGHAKAEYLSALTEGSLLMLAAVVIAVEAWRRFGHPAEIESFQWGAPVAACALLANLILGMWLRRVGRRIESSALQADSAHVLTDVWTSGFVLGGIALTKATRLWVLDPIIAVVLVVGVVRTGWRVLRDAIGALMDEAVPDRMRETIQQAVTAALPVDARWTNLRARRAGGKTFVELKLLVPGDTTVAASHELCDRVEGAIEAAVQKVDVVVHVEPVHAQGERGTSA